MSDCVYFRADWYSPALADPADFIRVIGTLLSKVNGMGKLESFNAVSSLILGQSENFIAYKGVLGDLSSRRLFTMAATAMSTVSLSIVGAYDHAGRQICRRSADPQYVQHLYRAVGN